MRTIAAIGVTLCFASLATSAQDAPPAGVAGAWEVEDTPFSIVIEVNGAAVGGMVVVGANKFPIAEGTVDGNRVAFKAMSPDGARTVTFTGTQEGDEIRFTRNVEMREGAPGGGAGLMGANGPPEFRARRASPASEVWTGTLRNAPTPRNPSPNPNPRPVTLSLRKMADPHWRWRGGDKEIDVRMFALPNQSLTLSAFDQVGDQLSFSATRPNGTDMTCNLTRQDSGRFEGRCGQGGGTPNQLLELVPPGAEAPPMMP
jgi:hypothetical protein